MEKIEDIVDNYYVQKFIRFMNIAFCVNIPSILDFDVDSSVSLKTQLPVTLVDKKTLSKYIQPDIYVIDDYIN